ncbi:hypothetical protein LC040_03480 [Bacillus tianshenii]|nr:hypothetical protein LC040_03480 [Bacillus tianshenii]
MKFIRIGLGANAGVLLAMLLLPAFLITQDVQLFDNFLNGLDHE